MGFLSDDEARALRISNMILHVVGEDEFSPAPARSIEHEEFFIERVRDTDVAAVYSFHPESGTKSQLERIAQGSDTFEQGAQALSREFSRLHVGSSREGAFFIFELLTADPQVRIYSLIKYDYREAIEQADNDRGSLLRRIVHAFIADKKAIQKSALVRVTAGTADLAVSARDRVKQAPEIGDYFAAFLDVERSRSDKELNEQVVDVLRETFTTCRNVLPEQDVARAIRHAKGILRDRQEVSEDAIADAVLAAAGDPQEEVTRAELQAVTRRRIRARKLEGLVFKPDRQILRRPPLRQIKTTEGVTLTYPDEAEGATVTREARSGGGETITIETEKVTEDRVVRDSAGRATGPASR